MIIENNVPMRGKVSGEGASEGHVDKKDMGVSLDKPVA